MPVDLNLDQLTRAGIGNFFRPSHLEKIGVPYHQLRRLESENTVERVGWGLYRFVDAEPTERYWKASVCPGGRAEATNLDVRPMEGLA